ncbi:PP2C-domain-containing protein [Testicularia cyperi]|uniref:protein-serine/threonine phosphatase n=1 Tax=Testicularia cyperi TaxID=1882483 RepID=A0A317XQK8_9BASI|nr:PP2C-domain-containing protein [Testicularia cyperi]
MGQTLSEPVTEKHTITGENDLVLFAISEMQGWRISMEDAHSAIAEVKDKEGNTRGSFFAVFDGHGGSTVAQYCGETLYNRLTELDDFEKRSYEPALKRAFLDTDEALLADANYANDPSGCTAVAAFISTTASEPKKFKSIYVANAGDSRCVMSSDGEAIALSEDHKPHLEGEYDRISKAGGYVSFGRVNGNLALSRAIGDFEFKRNDHLPAEEQIVTADPEIKADEISSTEEFVVLACDGIWDCLSSQDVVDVVRRSVADGKELRDICEDLMHRCLAPDSETGGIGCDNMTVCIVALLNGRTKAEWYEYVKKRVESGEGYQTPAKVASPFKEQSMAPGYRDEPMGGGYGPGGTVSIQSLLSGGLARGEDGDDESGSALRLPGGLAGALSGAGIVFRPGGTADGGEVVYEAHVVDEDDSGDDDSDKSSQGGNQGQLQEVEDDTAAATASKSSSTDEPPNLVESPRTDAKAAPSNPSATVSASAAEDKNEAMEVEESEQTQESKSTAT